MDIPRKHHYLPQFYLERFKITPQKGKYPHIYRVEKTSSPKTTTPAIKDTGCQRDYHTLDYEIQNRHAIESFFSKIEAKQAKLIDCICKSNTITEDQKDTLAEFLSIMRFRVPAHKRYIELSLKNELKSTFKIIMQQGKLSKPPKEIESLIQKEGYDFLDFNISNWKILEYMMQSAFQGEQLLLLRNMKYQLIIAPKGHHFLTGDSPVALYHPNYNSIKPYGVGPAIKGIEITIPLSQEHLVKLTWDGEEGVTTINNDEVGEYNRKTIIMAESQIFASEVNKELIEKISLLHNIKAGYQLDELWYGKGAVNITRFIPVTN